MGGASQPWMGSQNDQTAAPAPPPAPSAAPTSTDSSSPASGPTTVIPASPSGSPSASPPGSINDLESQINPDQLLQRVQQQAQQQAAQQAPPPGQLSPDNPHAKLVSYFQGQLDQMGPPPNSRGVKGALSNFFKGFGEAELSRFGVQPSWQRRQQLVENLEHANQLGSQWEEMQNMNRYRAALTNQMQQNAQFESQMQPLRIQEAQQAVAAGQQAATTIHPAMSAADLKSLGVPDDLAAQYEGHPLTSADFAQLKDTSTMAGANTRIYDYGQDGSGPNKGQWLVDKQFNPIKQLSPISETGRATALQKQQFAQQNALVKGCSLPSMPTIRPRRRRY